MCSFDKAVDRLSAQLNIQSSLLRFYTFLLYEDSSATARIFSPLFLSFFRSLSPLLHDSSANSGTLFSKAERATFFLCVLISRVFE